MPDEREIFSRAEFLEAFDADRIVPGGPVFDIEKLNWLNGQYLRELGSGEFVDRFKAWAGGQTTACTRWRPCCRSEPSDSRISRRRWTTCWATGKPLDAGDFEHKRLDRAAVGGDSVPGNEGRRRPAALGA